MRRDLSFGCSSCRLRFSSALSQCPACGGAALPAADAVLRIEPPTRAAWLVKWAVALSLVPALGVVASALVAVEGAQFPPKHALGVVVLVASAFGIFAGAGIVAAIPLVVWLGLVSLLRLIVGRFVDRPLRALRPALDRAPRKTSAPPTASSFAGLWDRVAAVGQAKRRLFLCAALGVLVALEVVAEIAGEDPALDTSSLGMVAFSLFVIIIVNAGLLGLAFVPARAVFGGFVRLFRWLGKPPALFGGGAAPPVTNDALLAEWRLGRLRVVGRAEPLGEPERAALTRKTSAGDAELSVDERAEVRSPALAEACFAFRMRGKDGAALVDDADAVSFVVVSDEGRRVVVDAADVVAALEPRAVSSRATEPAFFWLRGLSAKRISIREGHLRQGDRVAVTGHLTSLATAGEGYRQAGRLEVLDAEDGYPVILDDAGV